MAETQQEIGRVGAFRVKRLLEGTLRFRLPYNAYSHPERVKLKTLTGHMESFDLVGDVIDENGDEVTRLFVESKNVKGSNGQAAQFRRFLAETYSATAFAISAAGHGADLKDEFMWATTCPWKGNGFREVASHDEIVKAVEWDRDRDDTKKVGGEVKPRVIPVGHDVDHGVVRLIVDRVWIWVVAERQERMTLSPTMRGWVKARLEEVKAA